MKAEHHLERDSYINPLTYPLQTALRCIPVRSSSRKILFRGLSIGHSGFTHDYLVIDVENSWFLLWMHLAVEHSPILSTWNCYLSSRPAMPWVSLAPLGLICCYWILHSLQRKWYFFRFILAIFSFYWCRSWVCLHHCLLSEVIFMVIPALVLCPIFACCYCCIAWESGGLILKSHPDHLIICPELLCPDNQGHIMMTVLLCFVCGAVVRSFVHTFVHSSVCLSVCSSVHPSIIHLSIQLFVCPSVDVIICWIICAS